MAAAALAGVAGSRSFGIYLWHFQVMRVLILLYPNLWDTPATVCWPFSSPPATLVLAALSYYLMKTVNGLGKKYA
ncbi:MAG: hypothetical protein CM15mP74_20490 [Halieaceae bacterium]|nr:MAG: hypothetical protein CM15mP74_20490 [Halieaceae bacterium]